MKKPAEAPRMNSSAEKQSNNRQLCDVALWESDGAVRQRLLRLLEAVMSGTAFGGSITLIAHHSSRTS
jgi:hypothetical protein